MFSSAEISEIRAVRHQEPALSWGLVTTMGALHAGHLSLIERARAENDRTAATIFVNPTQFNNQSDLEKYPRPLESDLALLEGAGVDLVFTPTPEIMYPAGYLSTVSVGPLATKLEGAHRPGHFDGVTTVVAKLFNIIEPTRAYFGQKDAQQTVVLQRMVADLNFNLDLIVCPTLRESNGLAMSSRNERLSADHRQRAGVLYRALQMGQNKILEGERNLEKVKSTMQTLIGEEPAAKIEYISIADRHTLDEQSRLEAGSQLLISLAVYFGEVRLIDNVVIDGIRDQVG